MYHLLLAYQKKLAYEPSKSGTIKVGVGGWVPWGQWGKNPTVSIILDHIFARGGLRYLLLLLLLLLLWKVEFGFPTKKSVEKDEAISIVQYCNS